MNELKTRALSKFVVVVMFFVYIITYTNNNSLKHVTHVKDLGVTISLGLTWDTHINSILATANKMLALLVMLMRYGLPVR